MGNAKKIVGKKGVMLLRNIMFMVIMFAGVMALASLFVLDMASEYSNTNMTNEYSGGRTSGLGDEVLDNATASIAEMREATEPTEEGATGLIGAFEALGGTLKGATTIIRVVFLSPIIVGNAIEIMLDNLGAPSVLANLIGKVIILIIYALIIFGIITAALRGGKV